MKKCKFILKDISQGSFCREVKNHLAECPACAAVYEKEIQMEAYLLDLEDVNPPDNLKLSVLRGIQKARKMRHLLPSLQIALRTAGFVLVAVVGYWLGIQTANGNNNGAPNETEISQSQTYLLNTTALDQSSLSEIYFKVVEEARDEKR